MIVDSPWLAADSRPMCSVPGECDVPLGMQSGEIPDDDITVTSSDSRIGRVADVNVPGEPVRLHA